MNYNFDEIKKKLGISDESKEIKFEADKKESFIRELSDLRNQIASHCRLDNIVFLLGNGCSIYAGTIPTTETTFEDIYKKRDKENLLNLPKVLKNKSVEEILNVLIICQNYYSIIEDTEKENIVEKIINEIKQELLSSYVNNLNYESLIHHDILFRKFRNMGILNKVNIFTTNYDLAFEYSMDKLLIEYTNGFSGFLKRRFDLRNFQSRNKLKLYKVHGSVNWFLDEDGIVERQPIIQSNGIITPSSEENDVLIYPTFKKVEQTFNEPYSELMRGMLDALCENSNVIFVLGYKYNDSHINDILLKSLNNPNNIYYFFLYDYPDTNEFTDKLLKLSNYFDNIIIIEGHLFADFKIFADYMFPSVAAKNDKEEIKDLLNKVLEQNC